VQPRIGRHGVPFPMPKFRTMVLDAEVRSRPVQARVDDVRVVAGLQWIRASRLDELPQLVSVLQGRMSIVGPRPVRAEELSEFAARYTGYRRRLHTSPGITGLAQVYGNYYTHIEHKLGYDLHYLANWSPVRDLQIMARTAWVIVGRRL
jgi:lipopolysaccharide/colanic/teichoic acid biosynthesis glycosyltransferase